MGKRNLNQAMLDLDHKPFEDKSTLKSACFLALSQTLQGDGDLPLAQKMSQFDLLIRINAGGVVDFTSEEIALIKERARRFFPIIAFGVMCKLLEQEYVEPPELKVVDNA